MPKMPNPLMQVIMTTGACVLGLGCVGQIVRRLDEVHGVVETTKKVTPLSKSNGLNFFIMEHWMPPPKK